MNHIEPPEQVLDALIRAHLASLDATATVGGVTRRKAQGAHYTPPALVAHLLGEAMGEWSPSRSEWRALDPACGSGNFLVAVARACVARGEPIAEVLGARIHGVDIDPVAVGLARASLRALLPEGTPAQVCERVDRALEAHVVVGDALAQPFPLEDVREDVREDVADTHFDLIVGNPPFLNQLGQGTTASRARARAIASATNGAVRRYADLATAFLLTSLARLAPAGRLAFVMPQSFLSSLDVRAARDAALSMAKLRSIWSCRESLFGAANVRVCGVVFARERVDRPLRRHFGADFTLLADTRDMDADAESSRAPSAGDETWAASLAEGFGAPRVSLVGTRVLVGEVADATADFRDQYYGLAGCILDRDDDVVRTDEPRLLSTRHIDLASCTWGACEVRVHGKRYRRPVLDRARLERDPAMARWLSLRTVPKVLVATQTRVLEAWVDESGACVPLVPLITVTPRAKNPAREGPVDLWMLAAAIASPVVAARALQLYAGAALNSSSIKLSAKQLLAMPLPSDRTAWSESATHFRDASTATNVDARREALDRFAVASCRAHRMSIASYDEVLAFWRARVAPKVERPVRGAGD